MKTITAAGLKKMNVFQVIEQIVEHTQNGVVEITKELKPCTKELAKRLGISEMQALFLSVFVDQCDDNSIQLRDIARHFKCRTFKLLAYEDVINSLAKLGYIARRKDNDGDVYYRVPRESLEAIKTGKLPEAESYENLDVSQWINVVEEQLKRLSCGELEDDDMEIFLNEVIDKNQHLHLAQCLKSFALNYSDLVLYLVMSLNFINNHDDRQIISDIDDYFDRHRARRHALQLESGRHPLITARLVEHSCEDGRVNPKAWKLTDYSKEEVLAELNLKVEVDMRANLTHFETIAEKPLFYSKGVKKQIDRLQSLLEKDNMNRVLDRLGDNGFRKGFTCIFYGAPGTGKTETVMQLARMTKRDIMVVDIPSIRSKWVGETEQNIKALFERYHKAAHNNKQAPILLFNEADALLTKRNENSQNSVDKMENAMQNIILQEMETLEGIMIATTNLSGSLDAAFERRFLYKVEFTKPEAEERRHIWQAMLPDLNEENARQLAERFDFSGGQIENIARKRIITDILDGNEQLNLEAVIEDCESEKLNKKKSVRIGFAK